MKRFVTALALACLLSASALAGDLPTGGSPAPGDLPTGGIASPAPTETASPGDLPTGGFATVISDGALIAILSVLGFSTV